MIREMDLFVSSCVISDTESTFHAHAHTQIFTVSIRIFSKFICYEVSSSSHVCILLYDYKLSSEAQLNYPAFTPITEHEVCYWNVDTYMQTFYW